MLKSFIIDTKGKTLEQPDTVFGLGNIARRQTVLKG
jgi:hypothetical protein